MEDTETHTEATVLFFAKARELAGGKECKIHVPRIITAGELLEKIIQDFNLESIRNQIILAVNEEFVTGDIILHLSEKDRIAVIPPLSGGLFSYTLDNPCNMEAPQNFIKLQREELNVADIINLVIKPNCGAVSNFIGITRDNFESKKVIKLEYEAYEEMALKQMANICTEIRLQWNVQDIAIYHRIGEVPISKASIVIAISSPHREESLKATEYAINTLKAVVPIWKKEVYETGEPQWKQNKECTWENISNIIQKMENIELAAVENNIQETASANEEILDRIVIDSNNVQIQANTEELNRRIESFIERKRRQANVVNVREFCCHSEQNGSSCARVDAILMQRNDSKSHMKVHRVFNISGPQTVDHSILRKATSSTSSSTANTFPVLDDRISVTERILGINKPVPKDIYERLKIIEDKILYLEGISPEYKELWVTKDIDILKGDLKSIRKRTYSMAEIDSKLHDLEEKYTKRIK